MFWSINLKPSLTERQLIIVDHAEVKRNKVAEEAECAEVKGDSFQLLVSNRPELGMRLFALASDCTIIFCKLAGGGKVSSLFLFLHASKQKMKQQKIYKNKYIQTRIDKIALCDACNYPCFCYEYSWVDQAYNRHMSGVGE